MWIRLQICRLSWIPKTKFCAPDFCFEVVAVPAIGLPHPLQPHCILLLRRREAREERFEAVTREKREDRGVQEWVPVFQWSQGIRAGVEVKAALGEKLIQRNQEFEKIQKTIVPCQAPTSRQGFLQLAAFLEVAESKSLFLKSRFYFVKISFWLKPRTWLCSAIV